MRLKNLSAGILFSTATLLSTNALAGLVLETYGSSVATPETLGGYSLTDFAVTNTAGGVTSSVASPISGILQFENISGAALNMNRGLANDTSWWSNPEATDNDIFTTDVHWVKILLPENTRAITFNVGANFNGTGWIEGLSNNTESFDREYFKLGYENTPGFGVYADNSGGSCGSIASIVIDPSQWGVGNFSINQSDCTASVPEPGVLSLLAIGVVGLGVARKTNKAQA